MGYKYTGDQNLGISLSVTTGKPLDVRTVVDNLQELYSIPTASAYHGMTVANISDGNIYMLIDKANINNKEGWKASYESIQIIGCSENEYKLWAQNTTPEFTPKDSNLTYLHPGTYYYIYEDTIENKDQYYVSSGSFKDLQDTVDTKASQATVDAIDKVLTQFKKDVPDTYLSKADAVATYDTIESVNQKLEAELSNYYSKKDSDDIFVTKESLRGGIEGEEDNFVFVTQTQYSEDKQNILNELDKTIKTDSSGQLDSLTVNSVIVSEIKSQDEENPLSISVTKEGLSIGDDILAKQSEIPKIVNISSEDYNAKLEANELDPDVYYYVFDVSSDSTYVTNGYLESNYVKISDNQTNLSSNYYNKSEINDKLSKLQVGGDYVTGELIKDYYNKTEINSNFHTKEYSDNTYATKETVDDLTESLTNYVTKEDLKGSDSDDTDYKFVTQTEYSQDKSNNSMNFETQNLTSLQINLQKIENKEVEEIDPETQESIITTQQEVVSTVVLSSDSNCLLVNGDVTALSKDVPKIEHISKAAYDSIPKEEIKTDTYYFLYDPDDNFENGFITGEYLNENFYNKNQIEEYIKNSIKDSLKPLLERIAVLEANASSLDQGRLNELKLG